MNLKTILKERGIRCKRVVRQPSGYRATGLSFTGDLRSQLRMAVIAIEGYGYNVEIKERDQDGQTHYQLDITRLHTH